MHVSLALDYLAATAIDNLLRYNRADLSSRTPLAAFFRTGFALFLAALTWAAPQLRKPLISLAGLVG